MHIGTSAHIDAIIYHRPWIVAGFQCVYEERYGILPFRFTGTYVQLSVLMLHNVEVCRVEFQIAFIFTYVRVTNVSSNAWNSKKPELKKKIEDGSFVHKNANMVMMTPLNVRWRRIFCWIYTLSWLLTGTYKRSELT